MGWIRLVFQNNTLTLSPGGKKSKKQHITWKPFTSPTGTRERSREKHTHQKSALKALLSPFGLSISRLFLAFSLPQIQSSPLFRYVRWKEHDSPPSRSQLWSNFPFLLRRPPEFIHLHWQLSRTSRLLWWRFLLPYELHTTVRWRRSV